MSRAKYEGVSDMSDLSTTTARPAIGDRPGYVTDGGMETDLIFHRGVYPRVDEWAEAARTPIPARVSAVVSMTTWTGVIFAGRFLAYV